MRKIFGFSLLATLLLWPSFLMAQRVTISSCAPEYDGMNLVFYRYSDRISNTTDSLAGAKLDSNGCFTASFVLEETTCVYVDLGANRGYFFAVPGKSYHLILPPFAPLREADRLNPFFKPELMQLGVEESQPGELNYMIGTFDIFFNDSYNNAVDEAYSLKRPIVVDTLIAKLDTIYQRYNNSYFNSYRYYRIGLLEQMTLYKKARALSDAYFLNKPVEYTNPAYMDLFNKVYDRYFVFFSRSKMGSHIFSAISQHQSYAELKRVLRQDKVLANDTLLEAVILKGLHDGFYDDKFPRSSMLVILDSLYFNTTIPEHRIIAENIREKVTKLLPGFIPPSFVLTDANGKKRSLADFKGKYIYLNFATSASYTCLEEFKGMNKIYQKYGKYLEVVSVMVDESMDDVKSFLEQTGYRWTFLDYKDHPTIIKDFDVRAYPTYFLIGPDGKMLLSPAPGPTENFDLKFFDILKEAGKL
ncbi:MAG TPA: TlpA disulfide reductase family protein [Williamwhitmania sp.]|nr:TlpA disulfide reductase family protein [Williamwhitmania sp.]